MFHDIQNVHGTQGTRLKYAQSDRFPQAYGQVAQPLWQPPVPFFLDLICRYTIAPSVPNTTIETNMLASMTTSYRNMSEPTWYTSNAAA